MSKASTAIIAGATGLVGSHLKSFLSNSSEFNKVVCLVRKVSDESASKVEQLIFDYDDPESYGRLPEADTYFCCLGTTIAKAGSQSNFKKVDHHYPLQLASQAKKCGARQFHIVTAMGANSDSTIFYNRVKGEVERDIRKLDLNSLSIYRPSLILGNRGEQRRGESIAKVAMTLARPLMIGPIRKYRAIHAKDIAKAMFASSLQQTEGYFCHESDEIQSIADNS